MPTHPEVKIVFKNAGTDGPLPTREFKRDVQHSTLSEQDAVALTHAMGGAAFEGCGWQLVWSKQRGMEPESLSPRADWLYWGWGGGLVQHRVSRLSCGSWWQQQRLVPAFPIMGPCVLQHSNFCQFSQVGLLHSWFHCVLARLVAKGSADGRIASPRKQGWAGFYFLVLLELQDPPHLMSAVEWQPKSRARCKIVAKIVNSSLLCPIRYLL